MSRCQSVEASFEKFTIPEPKRGKAWRRELPAQR